MKHLAVLVAGFAMWAATLDAQSAPTGVPDSHRPPPGMCRIWIDGVPPAHQPAPTDCATAIRKRPMNARVVFGSETPAGVERGFAAPTRPAPANVVPVNVAPAPAPPHEERDRAAQQQREEQEKRAARRDPPPAQHEPPPAQRGNQEHSAPPPRPRAEKTQRPPHQSFSAHRPR